RHAVQAGALPARQAQRHQRIAERAAVLALDEEREVLIAAVERVEAGVERGQVALAVAVPRDHVGLRPRLLLQPGQAGEGAGAAGRTREPDGTRPSAMAAASGSSTSRSTVRFSGRAPNDGE